jgi:hypothetical protein
LRRQHHPTTRVIGPPWNAALTYCVLSLPIKEHPWQSFSRHNRYVLADLVREITLHIHVSDYFRLVARADEVIK